MALSDLTGEGDSKLVVADLGSGSYNMKLRVYKGTQMVSHAQNIGKIRTEIHQASKIAKINIVESHN